MHFAVLRSLQRAFYSPEEEGHYALASDCYCHFTSPIRRYPDLTVHRLLGELLAGRKPRSHLDELVVLGQHCSDCERRAEAAERELTKLKLLAYLSERIGEEMDAVVTGVESFGLFVEGVELPAQGLIHADALSDDYYCFRSRHRTRSRAAARARAIGWATCCGWPWRGSIWSGGELDFRLVERKKPAAKRRAPNARPRSATGGCTGSASTPCIALQHWAKPWHSGKLSTRRRGFSHHRDGWFVAASFCWSAFLAPFRPATSLAASATNIHWCETILQDDSP